MSSLPENDHGHQVQMESDTETTTAAGDLNADVANSHNDEPAVPASDSFNQRVTSMSHLSGELDQTSSFMPSSLPSLQIPSTSHGMPRRGSIPGESLNDSVDASSEANDRSLGNLQSVRTQRTYIIAKSDTGDKMAQDLMCPICRNVFKDPYMLTTCGHTFCFYCIKKSISVRSKCPVCAIDVPMDLANTLMPNITIAAILQTHRSDRKLKSTSYLSDIIDEPRRKKARGSQLSGSIITNGPSSSTIPTSRSLTRSNTTGRLFNSSRTNTCPSIHSQLHGNYPDVFVSPSRTSPKTNQNASHDVGFQSPELNVRHSMSLDEMAWMLDNSDDETDVSCDRSGLGSNHSVHTPQNTQQTLNQIENLMHLLEKKRQKCLTSSVETKELLTLEFLSRLKTQKSQALKVLQEEITLIEGDISEVDKALGEDTKRAKLDTKFNKRLKEKKTILNRRFPAAVNNYEDRCLASRNYSMRDSSQADRRKDLEEFKDSMWKLLRHNNLRCISHFQFNPSIVNSTNIVSSIDFDRNQEYFAVGGILKKIKIYDYDHILENARVNSGQANRGLLDHQPCYEMSTPDKISALNFSWYHKQRLAASLYDGQVQIWDACTGQVTNTLKEHLERCWSIDFNPHNPTHLASGADDGLVKIWDLERRRDRSVCKLDLSQNVCTVQWTPTNQYHLAVGTVDHVIKMFDIRNSKKPISTFAGHTKAVSYVKFLDASSMISLSTDSSINMWNINPPEPSESGKFEPTKSFQGHKNVKNFVGLTAEQPVGDYFACGSEDNCVYVYYRDGDAPVARYDFGEKITTCVRGLGDIDNTSWNTPMHGLGGSGGAGGNPTVTANSTGSTLPSTPTTGSDNNNTDNNNLRSNTNSTLAETLARDNDVTTTITTTVSSTPVDRRITTTPVTATIHLSQPTAGTSSSTQRSSITGNVLPPVGQRSIANRPAVAGNEFISAVCWKKNSNVIAAANSQGLVKILQLE